MKRLHHGMVIEMLPSVPCSSQLCPTFYFHQTLQWVWGPHTELGYPEETGKDTAIGQGLG
jgi:hypothetical protein